MTKILKIAVLPHCSTCSAGHVELQIKGIYNPKLAPLAQVCSLALMRLRKAKEKKLA